MTVSHQKENPGTKFMQVLDPKIYRKLSLRAKPLGITVQELLRVKVIPEFLYGDIQLNPNLVKKLLREGMFRNGRSRKVR